MRCALSLLLIVLAASATARQTIDVNVVYPLQNQSSQVITLSGTVEAKQHAQLASLEAGLVAKLHVEVGDMVEEGQALLSLNNRLINLQVASAKASLQAAKVNLAEAQRLYDEVLSLSEQQLVAQTLIAERAAMLANTKAQLARIEADVSLQQELLARHVLRAPFTGVIANRSVNVGEWITQQSAVFTLVDPNNLRLSVAVPQQYYRYLAKAEKVPVTVMPDLSQSSNFSAVLSRFVPVSNSSNRTFIAQIDLAENADLVAGMSARAEINVPNTEQDRIILPRSAVKLHPDGGSSVFVVENGKAKRVLTPYTDMRDGKVAIAGLDSSQAYAVSGVELLRDGAAVNAIDVSGEQL